MLKRPALQVPGGAVFLDERGQPVKPDRVLAGLKAARRPRGVADADKLRVHDEAAHGGLVDGAGGGSLELGGLVLGHRRQAMTKGNRTSSRAPSGHCGTDSGAIWRRPGHPGGTRGRFSAGGARQNRVKRFKLSRCRSGETGRPRDQNSEGLRPVWFDPHLRTRTPREALPRARADGNLAQSRRCPPPQRRGSSDSSSGRFWSARFCCCSWACPSSGLPVGRPRGRPLHRGANSRASSRAGRRGGAARLMRCATGARTGRRDPCGRPSLPDRPSSRVRLIFRCPSCGAGSSPCGSRTSTSASWPAGDHVFARAPRLADGQRQAALLRIPRPAGRPAAVQRRAAGFPLDGVS